MKLLSTLFLCIGFALAFTIAVAAADPPHRRALLVAVNGYTHHSDNDARELNTTPDVMALKSVLMAKWGFVEGDFKILQTPAETTHQSILKWFKEFLVNPAKPGDVIYFHYSGHGSTTKDPNRDTGVDQTLVPSDYSATDVSNDIRGRDITPMLLELEKPAHVPSSITLSFDSCYSGSITRGSAPVRGYTRHVMSSPVHVAAVCASQTPDSSPTGLAGGLFDPGLAARRGYLVISACRADETDDEVDVGSKYMGSLSYALSAALSEASETSTYHQVMDRVGSIMRAHGLTQEPQVEGLWDKTLFSGKLVQPGHTLIADEDHNSHQAELLAGFPMGITTGSKYNLYRKSTDPKTAPSIATAIVTSVDATHARLKCEYKDGVALSDIRGAIAVITERSYTPSVIKVDLSAISNHPRAQEIQTALDELGGTADVKAASKGYETSFDLRVLPASEPKSRGIQEALGADPPPGSLIIQRSDGSLIHTGGDSPTVMPNDGALGSQIALSVNHYVCWRTVNDLHNPDGSEVPTIEVKYVPCDIDENTKRVTRDLKAKYSAGHQLEVTDGSHFYAMVRNTGKKAAYVTILDLQSDGIVNAMWPQPRDQTSNLVPADGIWHKTLEYDDDHSPIYATIGPPLGPESVKVIATLEPSNFSFLDNNSRGRGPGPKNPLERLMDQAATGRGPSYGAPAGGWNVFGFNYTIIGK